MFPDLVSLALFVRAVDTKSLSKAGEQSHIALAAASRDRVIAMTRRPGRVKICVEVHAPKPRDYEFIGSPQFTRLERQLVMAVRGEVEGRQDEAVH